MKKMYIIVAVLLLIIGISYYANWSRDNRCWKTATYYWVSVNQDDWMGQLDEQQMFNKINRQTCAVMLYEACMHGKNLVCAQLPEETEMGEGE